MAAPKTSVALCTYNGAEFLPEQLASIAAQTLPPDEVVICDDGSSDRTLSILADFVKAAPFPVRVEHNRQQLGYRANFMKAASLASHDLIFFCDQDDIWLPAKIATVAAAFARERDLLLVYHNAVLVDALGDGDQPLFAVAGQRAVLAQQPMPAWHYTLGFTQAFRRELLTYNHLWPTSLDHMTHAVMAHDQWFIFLAAALGRVGYLDERLVRHRQHASNTYGVRQSSRWRRWRSRMSHEPEWDRLAEHAADRRAEILQSLTQLDGAPSRLSEAATLYRRLAEHHRRRWKLYRSTSTTERARSYFALASAGGYAGQPWSLSRQAAPRDLLAGVLGLGGRNG